VAAISASEGARPPRPRGASVRCLAARTFRSICDRREEYIDFCCSDLCRMTKKMATIPITAAAGPTKM
jgi:hypothetical protein